jgi:hypothetical protein
MMAMIATPAENALDALHEAQQQLRAALIAEYGDEHAAKRDAWWYYGDAYADLRVPVASAGRGDEVSSALDGVRAALQICLDTGVE